MTVATLEQNSAVEQAVVDAKHFGAVLKKLRVAAGMTQAELAEQAGIDQTAVSLLERGEHGPTWKTVLAFCHIFDVSCEEFRPRGRPRSSPPDEPPAKKGKR